MHRRLILQLLLGAIVLVAAAIAFRSLPVAEWLRAFQAWVRGLGATGYIVYAIAYAVSVVLLVPGTILTIGAGAIFGFVGGTIVVVVGATIGATLAFLLARTVMRKRVEELTASSPRFQALDRAIGSEGVKIVVLVRLAVVFPFTIVNYAFGLTAVRTWPYVVATFFGIMPATAAFVFASSAAATATTTQQGTITRVVWIAGAVAAIAASIVVARIATRAIRRAGV